MFFFLVSYISSTVGSICGIGGGVIIKPVLDALGCGTVSAISFLSGCAVLSMSCYSVVRSMCSGRNKIELKKCTFLAAGAALGGWLGKALFQSIAESAAKPDVVGAIQSFGLLALLIGALVYSLRKGRIESKQISHAAACTAIGIVLGLFSSFLGIGGGPINLAVLSYFFGMDTKKAAANSLYIILFSQITSLLSTLLTNTVPVFALSSLCFMVAGGILGGFTGQLINKKLDNSMVDKLFVILTGCIILISFRNALMFLF